MKRHIALFLALVMCISLLPATVAQAEEPFEIEYVFGLSAFNKDKMIMGSNSRADAETSGIPYYVDAAVLRNTSGGVLYYTPAMHWDYEVPAEYSNTTPKAAFKSMNLEKTAPWAFEAHKIHYGSPILYDSQYYFEYVPSSYTTATPSFAAFRLKVETPGTYDLSVLSSNRQEDSPVTAVYFFKDGLTGVTNSDVSTYPASAKLGYYDLYNALRKYKTIGSAIEITEAGEYIIAFVGDATSATENTKLSGTVQRFYLSGIKLTSVDVSADELQSISVSADKTDLVLGGENANLSVKATYSVTGEKAVNVADVQFAVEGDAVTVANGVVTAAKEGTAKVTATYEGKTSDLTFTVVDNSGEPAAFEHEYVFGLSAFNKDKMIMGSNSRADAETSGIPYYIDAAVLRNTSGGVLYYTPAMHWDYEVPAEYSNTTPKAAFKAMNLEATDPWAFEAHKVNYSGPILYDGQYYFEYLYSSYTGATPSFAAFRLKVGAPGTYDISVLSSNRQEDSPVTAVYFFKDGTAGVTNSDISTYPASSKLGYYDLYNALRKYKVVGTAVEIPAAGDYIIAFVGDATSATENTKLSGSIQRFYLSGVKLTPVTAADEVTAIALSSDKTELVKDETANLSLKATWSQSGEKTLEASKVTFTASPSGIVEVSADGVVTALAKGTATVTAKLNANTNISSSVEFTVAEDELTGISISADKTALYTGGEGAQISASEIWSISGEKALDLAKVELEVAPSGVITVDADGKVSPVAEGTAKVTATLKDDNTKTATLDFGVVDPADQREYEFVYGLSAFNKANMIYGANSAAEATEDKPYYVNAPVLRNSTGGLLYYTPAMHWDYTVPAKYSNTDPQADFKSMNLEATDPWAFEAHKITLGRPILFNGQYQFEFTRNSYTTATPSFVAFRLKVDAPGEYILQTKAARADAAPVPAVYFFKDGTSGVTNGDISTYPASAKLGYFEIPKAASAYTTIGNVSIPAPGEYIIAFVGDATSASMNTNVTATSTQTLNLTGIKLLPAADDEITELTVTASKTKLTKNDTFVLSASGTFSVSGKRDIEAGDISFVSSNSEVVTVDADGVIKAVGVGEATVTATYKKDDTKVVTIDFVVEENVLTEIKSIADNTTLFVDGTANIFTSEIWTVTGTASIQPSAVTFESSDDDIITVDADGKVKAVGIGNATVTVTLKADNTKTATVEFSVIAIPEQSTLEFVTALSAFNKANMIYGANSRAEATENVPYYMDAAVLRNSTGGILYYQPAMHWNYIVPAKYSALNPQADFKAMNLTKTAPWSLEGYKISIGQAYLHDAMFMLEFKPANYGTDSPSYAAFRLKIDAPGEYIFQAKGNKRNDAPVPAVYFFKDGTEGVTNTTPSTYPEEAKLRYFDINGAAGEYVSLGRVMVTEPGEYIVSFVGDEESKKLNSTVVESNSSQNFQLIGIKLIPSSKDKPVGGINITAKNQLLMVGREMQVALSRNYEISGAVKITDFENYTFESSDETVATVDENGLVTGVAESENPVTITVTMKSDPTVKGTILFKVVPLSEQETYEYKTTMLAFNYDKMDKVPGIVPKVTDDYYYRDLLTELGFGGIVGIMIMNERLADPDLVIPANYYGAGKPAADFYAMDTTDLDGDAKGTDPWKFVGANAMDNDKTTVLQIRGDENVDGLHPYFDRTLYNDTKDTQFYALSLDVPAAGEYMLTLNAKRHGNAPAPAIYFFKDTEGAYTDASFIETATKLGYFKANDTTKQGYEYIANVNVPEAGKYVLAFVMDSNCANLAQGFLANRNGAVEAQYLLFMGIKLIPSYEDLCTKLSIKAEMPVMYCDQTLQLNVNEVWDIAGEKEVLDLSSIIFTSSDEDIARVDETGLVTGVAPGEVTITAVKKNTYPEVKATYKISLYDPNEPILGVRINYVTGSIVMKDQTTYTPHNERLDTAGNLRNINLVNHYDTIDGSKTTLWAYNTRGNLTWQCLQKMYFTLATAPAVYEKDPFFALKIRVPMKGEFYFNVETSGVAWGSNADFYLAPANGVDYATREMATPERYIGEADSRVDGDVRIGKVNVPMPGDYFLILKFHSDNPNFTENRNEFRMKGFSFIAPPGEFAKVKMSVEGLSGEGDVLPCQVVRSFSYILSDAAGVALEDVDPEDIVVNSISMTKGAPDIANLVLRDGNYTVETYGEVGEVEITADVTYKGKNVVTVFPFLVDDIGKTGRTIYTDEMVANARKNIEKYSWARSSRDSAIKNADKLVALGEEYLWNMISGQGLPRAYNTALEVNHTTRDPYEFYCRYCGVDCLTEGHGNYFWKVDAFNDPWKVKCPECSRRFPSNDFGSFYELGRTQENHGLFDRITALENHRQMLIDKGLMSEEAINMDGPGEDFSDTWYKYYGYGVKGGYLYNDLYYQYIGTANGPFRYDPTTETAERWGVDDGYGYNTGRVYDNGCKEVHTYIAYFNHFGVYSFHGTALICGGLSSLSSAYLLTGDEKYGRLGAILIDRMADVYPDMNIKDWSNSEWRYPNSTGGSPAGKDLGRIWAGFTAEIYADAYDVFWPMAADEKVVKFLSEKAAYYGMENDKTTAAKIRSNGADGICREIFNACKNAHVLGNFGIHQGALIKAAIALDDKKDTAAMIDWLYAASSTDNNSFNTGGDISRRLLETVYRDGMNTESPYYNQMGLSDLIDSAVALERYSRATGGIDRMMLLENPKYLAMFNCFQTLVRVERGISTIGDTNYALNYPQYPTENPALKMFKNTQGDPARLEENIKMAQQLWLNFGEKLKTMHYDIYTENPESIYEEVKAVIDEYGEHDYNKSSIMTGYGFAMLRDGVLYDTTGISDVRDTTRGFTLNFSGHHQHNHSDMLDLQIDSYGLPLTYDFGYAEFMVTGDPFTRLTSSTIGHNTVVVDEESSATPQNGTPQEPLHFDAKDTRVKVMDARTPDAYPTKTDDYRRTVVMVDYDDEVSYGVDFFRVDGGKDHLYTFSPSSNTRPQYSDNLTFIKQVDEPLDTWIDNHRNYYPYSSYAGPSVQFGEDPGGYGNYKYPAGYTWMYDVERADNPGTGEFYLDWAIKDFRKQSRNRNLNLRLRMTMVNDFDVDEVSLVSVIPQRIQQSDGIDHFEKVLVRRKGTNLDSLFTTVYEPYKEGSRYVTAIEQVEIARTGGAAEGDDDEAQAVKVTLGENRTDYIVYATNRDVIYTITDGDYSFEFSGFVGVWTVNANGECTYKYLHDGTILGEGENKLETAEAAVTGKIVDFQREYSLDNWIDVEFDRDMGDIEIEELVDRMIVPEREKAGNSCYLIEGIEKTGDRTARINLNSTSTIDGFVDPYDEDKGYVYVLTGGENFEIPMSYEDNGAPVFDAVEDKRVSAGSSINITVNATPITEDLTVSYAARTLPRGATFDAETATFSWKPTSAQAGTNLVALDAIDSEGRVSTIYFEVEVLGSTSGGGGGGGIDLPPKDDEPTTDEPGTDEPGTDVPTGDKKGFTDLGNHAWAEESINALADEGIIKGTSEETFSPAANITRADYAILLVRAFELESDSTENFADVESSDYFAEELAVARNTGIVNGIGDNNYAPRKTITRQDMMVILYRALTKLGIELKPVEGLSVENYPDFANVADYAQEAVKALVEAGLVNGKSGRLAGDETTTRAEVAVLVKRIIDYIAK